MSKTALFAGSFDPFTKGHQNIVDRALQSVADNVIIAIGVNHEKKYMFSLEERLQAIQELDGRAILLEQLILALWHRSRNNEWSTSIVNQHRIDLIDNGEVMLALNKIILRSRHIIAKIVKAELVVCTEGDICQICLATSLRVWLV